MLYYMDYHWGENKGNTGEDRIITAFSNQGHIDAVQRNYKGLWVDSHGGNSDAERDYYILNGVIKDKKRYDELKASGELSFEELINYVNQLNIDSSELLNGNFVNENNSAINANIKENESKFYDILPDKLSLLSNHATSVVGLIQLVSGVAKFGENIVDAVNMAFHSDIWISNLQEFNGIKQNYNSLANSCWNEYMNSEMYNDEFSFFTSQYTDDMARSCYESSYYYPDAGGYLASDGKIYSNIETIKFQY